MKRLLLSFLIICPILLFAQQKEKIVIDIINFQKKSQLNFDEIFKNQESLIFNGNTNGDARQIQEYIAIAFAEDPRMIIQEYGMLQKIDQEKELQKDEAFIDGKVVEIRALKKPQYLLHGILSIDRSKVELALFDIQNKAIIFQNELSIYKEKKGKRSEYGKTKQQLLKQTKLFIEKALPQSYPIVEIISGKQKAKKVLVAYGLSNSATKGTLLKIKWKRKEIGSIVVKEIQGQHFSVCKVKSGGKEIALLFQEGTALNASLF